MTDFELHTALEPPPSPARTRAPEREPMRVALVQDRWHPDPEEHEASLAQGVELAAAEGARLICLQELTLSPYFAIEPDAIETAREHAEAIPDGPTCRFAARLAAATGAWVHASLHERADDGGLGYNTAVCLSPSGEVVARTRKLHIPRTAGYHEDRYFRPGDSGAPVIALGDAAVGFPTCWDQWFPELARAYALAGADVIVYPTAIGSEPDHPDFDTEPLWRHVVVANGIANGLFVVAVNRIGDEGPLRFYGSSFISDPYGRLLVQAPRDRPAVLVATLDLDQRRDWLELFPLLTTRRPDMYGALTDPIPGAPPGP
jgi:N-carbamoylputrescine amidase